MIIGRIFTIILSIILIPLLPWWLWSLMIVFFVFFWDQFYEVLFLGLFYDIVSGTLNSWYFPFMIFTLVTLIIVEILKTRLMIYS